MYNIKKHNKIHNIYFIKKLLLYIVNHIFSEMITNNYIILYIIY